ncbi:MAG: hypothetical protein WC573_05710, partial [Brevundimonas sp.]|uniref:hypothetical protein n=1 Tax=Brevundimonas sp. TaxID=1871086 RepID=UPI003565A755
LGSQFWAGGIGSHLRSLRHCDETQSLHYPQPQICAKGADAEQMARIATMDTENIKSICRKFI